MQGAFLTCILSLEMIEMTALIFNMMFALMAG